MMCSKIALTPCLSFSHNLSGSELQVSPERVHDGTVPYKNKLNLLDSIPEFEFSTTSRGLEFESSSADELFSNGVILPVQVQEKKNSKPTKHTRFEEPPYTNLPPRQSSPRVDKIEKESTRKVLDVNGGVHEKKPQLNSLWSFSKSRSLHCDAKNNSLGCSSPPLPRSKSTGSSLNLKRVSSKSSSALNNLYPLPKSKSGKSYVNSLRVSPVLNLPTPSFSKGSASLFGLCSFLCAGKAKKVKN
uniref:Uncharacterized protein n=1 Tax=Lotus japonicus TaxID=34305 RepID=I3SKB5_LOTJA|nr:unknown [Lotus japonicus]